jgi:spore coat protein U-like protein
MKTLAHLCLAVLLAGVCHGASAGISCGVTYLTGTAIPFTPYDPLGSSTGSMQFRIDCNVLPPGGGSTTATMSLSNGSSGTCLGPLGRSLIRQSAPPAATLGYNIFVGASSVEWGNAGCGTAPTVTLNVNPGSSPTDTSTQTLRGVIPSGQFVPDGTYSETLTLTIQFL